MQLKQYNKHRSTQIHALFVQNITPTHGTLVQSRSTAATGANVTARHKNHLQFFLHAHVTLHGTLDGSGQNVILGHHSLESITAV